MASATIDEDALKRLVRSALVEALESALVQALEERRDLLQGIVEEALEDIGLVRAIDEGLGGPSVSRKQILSILEAKGREG
jgi:hypothetical protein